VLPKLMTDEILRNDLRAIISGVVYFVANVHVVAVVYLFGTSDVSLCNSVRNLSSLTTTFVHSSICFTAPLSCPYHGFDFLLVQYFDFLTMFVIYIYGRKF
jgi:hypothetical protein